MLKIGIIISFTFNLLRSGQRQWLLQTLTYSSNIGNSLQTLSKTVWFAICFHQKQETAYRLRSVDVGQPEWNVFNAKVEFVNIVCKKIISQSRHLMNQGYQLPVICQILVMGKMAKHFSTDCTSMRNENSSTQKGKKLARSSEFQYLINYKEPDSTKP